jgi:hypothetical protein
VTKHDTNPGLFNTKFRLNFQSAADHQASFFNNPDDMSYNSIVIGELTYESRDVVSWVVI